MLKTVILAENPLDSSTWETFKVEDIREFLTSKFETFPETGRIYHNQVAENCDITPSDEHTIERLGELEGVFYVVIYPGEVATIYAVVSIVIALVSAVASYYYSKNIPNPAIRNTQTESPNNGLSDRQNQSRINGRIPDIVGTVRSTPDLLQLPYKVFENNIEVEYAYMCIGRGEYELIADEAKDDTTPISSIEGATVEVFAPFTSPNSGDAPQLRIGEVITQPLYNAKRTNAVNGQVLKAQDGVSVQRDDIEFRILGDGVSGVVRVNVSVLFFDFRDYYAVDEQVELIDANVADSVSGIPVNLDGVYTIYAVDSNEIGLRQAPSVNADWSKLTPLAWTIPDSATITAAQPLWIGPFIVQASDLQKVFSNFVALNGLYVDSGTAQSKIDVEIQLGLTPIDVTGAPVGDEITFEGTVEGSATSISTRALTLEVDFGTQTTGYGGSYSVRARRVTPKFTSSGTVIDEIKWRDLYSMSEVTDNDFGNVTTVHSVTQATEGALVVKSRKLNMLVTRKIPLRVSGSTFTTELFPTNRADEIISFLSLDPFIGNRTADEIDFDNIYDTVAEIEAYFGIEKAVEFNYTFDNENLSFEETIASVATAIYCNAFRRGNQLKLSFEKETEDSTLLFNHRNKLPGSESRSVRFGNQNLNDGVELEYVSPDDDAILTYYIPTDKSATNPRKVETIGLRNKIQAFFQAWRIWNKIQYQNTSTEFEATQEADLLVVNDRILVADNTRPGTQDGQVVSQNGLELEVSQPVIFDGVQDYTIFLQHTDGTTESIEVFEGSDSRHVLLPNAPKAPLSLEWDAFAKATYQIVGNDEPRSCAFLVAEKQPQGNFTSIVNAINYDERYYTKDSWYADGIINEDGEANLAGGVIFSPLPGEFFSGQFPVSVTITKEGVGATVRYSKTSMPGAITEGIEYTTPVDMVDGETLYARAFTPIDTGVGSSGSYTSVPNLDFQFATNSQYIPII